MFVVPICIQLRKKEIPCFAGPSPISSATLTVEGTDANCRLQNISNSQEVGSKVDLVIQSQAEYEKYVLCESALPAIDFSKKALLAGRYIAAHMDWVENQRVYQDCNGKLVFEVRLEKGGYTAVTEVFYFAGIPKVSNQTEVTFDISY